jgi:tol-pal system protein YbgF
LATKLVKLLLVLVIALSAVTSHAALFDDKEARKKILEVEAKSQANHDASMAAIAKIEKRLVALEAVVQGQGLADMSNQIDALKQEVADLKGELELANHTIDNTQQRQKDLYTDTDTRLRKIESGSIAPVNAAPAAPAPVVEEKDAKAYMEADNLSKAAKHKEAFAAFDAFLKEYPNSKFVPDALYGMGYSQFALKNYKSSIATQQKVIDLHPENPKVPDAMYNLANSQIQLGQVTNAKKTLRALVDKFPNADITPSAQKRLKMLDALK